MQLHKIKFVIAMLIFGSIGIVVKNIGLVSPAIVQWRTIIGSIFLLMIFILRKKRLDLIGIRKNLSVLIIAGFVLGGGWAFLFEAYGHTSVAVATMAYYCAPIIVFSVSPILFKEKITLPQVLGMMTAIVGMVIINLLGEQGVGFSLGMIYGLISALFYAALMIANKFIKGLSGVESTWVQLMVAAIVMTMYVFITTGKIIHLPQANDIWLILMIGVLHTGIACNLYFSSMQSLPGQSISILSYIDPASALIFAFVFLGEALSIDQILGAILIFGGTIFSQIARDS